MSAVDLATLSGAELAVAIRSGKTDVNSVVAHLANRLLPAEGFGALLASGALPPEFFGAVMLAQSALQQKTPAKSAMPAIRATVSASGKRIVCVQPPKTCKGSYVLTNPPETWLWILDNAAMIKTAVADAQAISDADVARITAEKLVKKAASSSAE